jgi:AcrR family transcriptional regulator
MAAKSSPRAGRPCTFNQEQALDRAMHVFWEKGFEGASIHDLTAAMGIRPASLYAAFGNKEAVFELALAHYLAGPAAFMRAALEEPLAYGVAERILSQTAEFLTARRARYGCMTIQAALAGGKGTKGVRQKLIRLRVRAQNALRRRFEQSKSDGDLPEHVDAVGLADFITCVFQGMTVQAINGASREQLLRIAKTVLRAWPSPNSETHGNDGAAGAEESGVWNPIPRSPALARRAVQPRSPGDGSGIPVSAKVNKTRGRLRDSFAEPQN